MKTHIITLLLITLFASTTILAITYVQSPPAPAPMPWTVADNGNFSDNVLFDNSAGSVEKTVSRTNNGADHSIEAKVIDSHGRLVARIVVLESLDSVVFVVPAGGAVLLRDPNDSDSSNGSGTFTVS